MAWAAALGLAGSAFSAISANNRAQGQMEMQQRQLDQQRQFQDQQMALARDAQRTQEEDNRYRRQIEQMNRAIAEQERDWRRGQVDQQRDQLMEERRTDIERQIKADREAARNRQFQIEQMLQNQDLAQEEREFAISQLQEAKAVAAGERDEDKRRFLEERAMAEANRDFVMQEYQQAKQQQMAERDRELGIQRQIMSQAGSLQNTLQNTASQLGVVPEIPQVTRGQIEAEINRRTGQYQSDVDRAADRVASVNEAELIRNGLDASTPGTARRGDVASRLSQEYQNARQRAYDDALGYITGRQNTMATNVQNIMDRRQQILGETGNIASTEMQALQNLGRVQSASDAYNMAAQVPTGIYNRNIQSANDYQAPVRINSGIYDSINPQSGIANYIRPSSATQTGWQSVGSSITNPAQQTIGSPSSYYGQAAATGQNIMNTVSANANTARSDAMNAAQGFGSDVSGFLADNSDGINDFMGGLFGGGGGSSSGNMMTYSKSMFGL